MEKKVKQLRFANNLKSIDNLYELKKIGAGHDGIIYEYENQAIKELKYDLDTRKQQCLMTFDKVQYFIEWSKYFKRIVAPHDILLDNDGMYCAYSMDLIKKIDLNDYPISNTPINIFLNSIHELYEDFEILNKMHVLAKDINSGSYLFDENFIHLCDLDKYIIYPEYKSINFMNKKIYNYTISKFLYSLMYDKTLSKEDLKKLSNWVRKCSGNNIFLNQLDEELTPILNEPIGEYTNNVKKKILVKS